MLVEYYFKIEYVKGTDNIKVNIFSRKAELQSSKKPLNTILRINKDRKIRYNYLKLIAVYEALISNYM